MCYLSLLLGVPKIIGQLLISLHVFFAFLIISNPVYQELEELFRVPQSNHSKLLQHPLEQTVNN